MSPLQLFPRHPESPDTYYIDGAWAPACITAVDKRFTDAELAAEYFNAEAHRRCIESHMESVKDLPAYERAWDIQNKIHDFATLPHHHADPA